LAAGTPASPESEAGRAAKFRRPSLASAARIADACATRRAPTPEAIMSPAAALEVRVLPLGDLTPAPYNPRRRLRPADSRYRKLAASLREFGLVEPLVWNELTGHVVGGHARLAILRELGAADVPVSVVRLTPEREKALNVVLNNLEAQGRFDPTRLADLLTELEDLPELELTGFDARDLADLRLEPVEEPAVEEGRSEVEITLTMDAATYDRLAARLEALVAEFDLVCHVQRT
jgi:ParB-like chromosome segregation protein Spo0J